MKNEIELVTDLNGEFYERSLNEEWSPFSLETDGVEFAILFCGWPVFQSGSDVLDENETMHHHIMTQVNDLIDNLEVLREIKYR